MAGMGKHNQGDFEFAETAEINVTPFIDVLLVLLVIFMIAVPLSTTSVPMDLPISSATPPPVPEKPIELNVDKQGSVFLGNEPVSGDVATALRRAGAKPDTRILLRADKTTSYGSLMGLLDQVRAGGFTHLSLVGQLADAG